MTDTCTCGHGQHVHVGYVGGCGLCDRCTGYRLPTDSSPAVPEAARDAAEKAIKELRHNPCRHDYEGVPVSFLGKRMSCDECVSDAALAAALPHIREQIAQEIEAAVSTIWQREGNTDDAWCSGLDRAARIVRGTP